MQKILDTFIKLLYATPGLFLFLPLQAHVTYSISPASKIEISGTSTLSDWVVRSGQVSGEMTFAAVSGKPGAGHAVQAGMIKDGKAILEVSSIKSEKGETMDNKLYKALKNDAHPRITFSLTQPVQVVKGEKSVSATGNVEIAGLTRPMTFDLTLSYLNDTFHLRGSRSLKLSDFNIEPPTAMFGQIVTGDEITVGLDLTFTP